MNSRPSGRSGQYDRAARTPPSCNFAVSRRAPFPRRRTPGRPRRIREAVRTADDTAATSLATGADAPTTAGAPRLALGRYRLERRLGAGAFGVVWLAHDEDLGRLVAVKRIELHDERIAARAEREARAAARLAHPAIVALYEARRDADAVYLVSELVRGRPLDELCRARALSDRDVLRIGVALCGALEHAHARGVVHRDIKPANIIVPRVPHDESGMAKLTDFGVAHLAGDDAMTRTGDVVGTLAYMSPEQAEGGEITTATDLYALALVLYEALAHVNPVRAGGAASTARRVGSRLPTLGRYRPDLPADLVAAIDTAVLPEPWERGEVGDLRAALRAAVADAGRIVARRPADPEPDAEDDDRDWTLTPEPRRGPRLLRRAPRPEPAEQPQARPGGLRVGLVARLCAAASVAALTAAALALLGAGAPADEGAAIVPAAAAAALAVLLLPRAGTLAVAAALTTWLAAAGSPGIALLLAAGAVVTVLALPRDGAVWSLPLLAPLLALVGCALAWPAIAGQAASGARRAALGALGVWWIALAEPLARHALLLGDVPGAPGRRAWEGSAGSALDGIVGGAIGHGLPLVALVWALAAWCLPLLVRGWSVAVDLVLVTAWSAGLAAGTLAAAQSLPWSPHPVVAGVTAGAPLAAVLALVAAGARPRGEGGSLI